MSFNFLLPSCLNGLSNCCVFQMLLSESFNYTAANSLQTPWRGKGEVSLTLERRVKPCTVDVDQQRRTKAEIQGGITDGGRGERKEMVT